MVKKFKKIFYFFVAAYFAFWAKKVLKKWQPRIIVVTGSTGKTTLFTLLHAQLGQVAEFAKDANSAFGIPFHILGLQRETFSFNEWFGLFFSAPFQVKKMVATERKKIYVVEADSDRPGEAKFTTDLLEPNIVLITNIYRTHAMNFDEIAAKKEIPILDAIAQEFAYFASKAKEKVIVNGESLPLVKAMEELNLSPKKLEFLQEQDYLVGYQLQTQGTEFAIDQHQYSFNQLLPEEMWTSLAMVEKTIQFLGLRIDTSYKNLTLPPGRSSLLHGLKNTLLIDSTYNANYGSMEAMLKLFEAYPATGSKFLVLGHMLEEGEDSKTQHESLAWLLLKLQTIDRVYLLGRENRAAVLPLLQQYWGEGRVDFFESPKLALEKLWQDLKGGETILFKGAPFLEGMVERLLADKADIKKLVRQEEIWQKRRNRFYV